jgi:DivIVA domain-containing protein
MALTPEDVVTKQFQHVRFKEGFDPDEVDDFLDEIVVEWRKTIAENEELKAKLAAYESGESAPAEVVEAAVVEEAPRPSSSPFPLPRSRLPPPAAWPLPPASSSWPSACTTSTSPKARPSATSSSPRHRPRPPRSSPRPRPRAATRWRASKASA